MTPIFLSNKIPWFGHHTGYQQLPRYMQKLTPLTKVIASKNCFRDRLVGKAYSLYRGWASRNQPDAAAELRFMRANGVPTPVKHVLHFEDHFMFFDQWPKAPRDFMATLHIPREQWTPGELAGVKHVSSAIVLYQRDMEFYESYVGKGRVKFVRHGVDVDFFRPRSASPHANRILYSGHYLRNTSMLSRVIQQLAAKHSDLEFHLLVPEAFREQPGLDELQGRPGIIWHQNLTDDELRNLICSSYLSLLPMNDSGANTAVVESLACGTPIVTTDVGGIRDYGGGRVFPVVPNDDDGAMIDLVEEYLGSTWRREETSRAGRDFAVSQLAWPLIARQHLEIYETLAT
jgi:glycosyltransferase involved in cell wall biosynthesis